MTSPATRRARVKMSAELCNDAAEAAARAGLSLSRANAWHYIVHWRPFVDGAPGAWGLDVYPASQRIVRAWGNSPTLDLGDEWNILGVVLAVVKAMEDAR